LTCQLLLEDKAAIVTAAGSGIGKASALRFAYFKVPEIIEFTDALPRNAAGKVLRSKLPDD
jgi:acyl-CoA synthetase (AMP-forming)/AMP-acid ligase II